MTVIEHEPVTITPTETEDDPVKVLLRTVRDKFASHEYEWIQHEAYGGNNNFCLMGAIKHASAGGKETWMEGCWSATGYEAAERLENLTLPLMPHRWNDKPGRTLPEVIDLLDEAIGA